MFRRDFFKTLIFGMACFVLPVRVKSQKIENEYRTVEFYDFECRQWKDIEYRNLRAGMKVRMFEPNGEPVMLSLSGNENEAFCKEDAFLTNGVWATIFSATA